MNGLKLSYFSLLGQTGGYKVKYSLDKFKPTDNDESFQFQEKFAGHFYQISMKQGYFYTSTSSDPFHQSP